MWGFPEDWPSMPPGPKLAAILSSIDRDQISGHDRVVLVRAWNRQVAHDQAELYASMVAVADAEHEELSGHLETDEISDLASSEIRAALTWTRRAADTQLGWATQLVEDYPRPIGGAPTGIDRSSQGKGDHRPALVISNPNPGTGLQRWLWNGHRNRPPDS